MPARPLVVLLSVGGCYATMLSAPAGLRDLAGQSVLGAAERPPLIIGVVRTTKGQTVADRGFVHPGADVDVGLVA